MRRSLTMYEWVWLIIVGIAVPLLALMIWDSRPTMSGVENAMAIVALNLLLGWTFIGWVIALVWTLTAVRRDAS